MSAATRTALWLTAYVIAGVLGRLTALPETNIGLVWPAAGIAFLWLASGSRATWLLDVALLAVATVVVLLLTEGGLVPSLLSLVSVAQAVLAVWLLRRWVPGVWGAGGRVAIARLGQFGRLLLAVATAALVAAVLRTTVDVLLSDDGLSLLVGRWGRNATAMATIGTFGLFLGGWIAERHDAGHPVLVRPTTADAVHALGILSVTALIFVVGFWHNPDIPTTFMLTLTAVWAGVRFGALMASALSLVIGSATVLATIEGVGPIAGVEGAHTRALVAQAFVIVMVVVAVSLALSRQQFFDTIGRLERSEETLSARAEELDIVMSHLDDAVAIIEEGGRVVHANTAMRTAFGTRPVDSFDRVREADDPTTPVFHPDGRPMAPRDNPYLRALSGEVIDGEEYHHTTVDGVTRVLEVSAFPVPHGEGTPQRVMVVVRDVTAVSTQRETLAAFAGTVAHDLNNPLSVIDGWAEALEEVLSGGDSPEAVRAAPMVGHIRASARQMRVFISDLLAHSMARDQALQCELVPLRNLVKHIVATRDLPNDVGEIVADDLLDVWADRVLLRQVLDNLIGNAFKYVRPGVTPRVVIEAEQQGDGWACIRVRDNGIGVPPEHRERIFDSYHRASSDGYTGTGLGLAICRRTIERHGGTIRATGNPDGVGSCFELTLPMTREAFEQTRH